MSRSRRARAHKSGALATPAKKSLELDIASNTIQGFIGGSSVDQQISKNLSQAELYWYFANHHPWIGSATGLIARTIAGAGYNIVAPGSDRDQGDVDKDPRVIALRVFLDQPNPDQSIEDLVEEISLDRDVPGKFYVHKLRLPNGQLVGLERIDSRTCAPLLSADGKSISKFVQKTRVNGKVVTTTYDPKDIIFGKLAGGADITGRTSLIDQIDLTLAVDWGARKSEAGRFKNGVRAGMVLVNKTASKDQLEHNRKTMEESRSGADNAHRPMALAGDWSVEFPPAQNEENTGQQDRARQEICAIYHVPESKLMTTEGTLGGNGKESDDQTFQEECVLPRARYIWRTLSRAIMAEFGITDLAIVPKAKYQLRMSAVPVAVQLLQAGGSINEARDLIELPKSAAKDVDLDTPLVQGLLKSAESVISPPPPPAPMFPPGGPKQGTPVPDPGQPSTEKPPEGTPAKKAGARDGGHTDALNAYVEQHLDDVAAAAKKLGKALQSAHAEIADRFFATAQLPGRKSVTVDDDGTTSDGDSEDAPLPETAIARLRKAIDEFDAGEVGQAVFDAQEALYDLGFDRARVLLDVEAGLFAPPTATIKRLKADADAFAFLVRDREKAALRSILSDALEQGLGAGPTAKLIESAFDVVHVDGEPEAHALDHYVDPDGEKFRQTASGRVYDVNTWSKMVARTEMSVASNAGAKDFYVAAGLQKVRWIAADGPATCDECAEADEQVVSLGEDFPGVDVDTPPAHPNCVCAIAPADDDLDLEQFRGTAEDRAAAARGNQPATGEDDS
jgi:phage portal protein BeeE